MKEQTPSVEDKAAEISNLLNRFNEVRAFNAQDLRKGISFTGLERDRILELQGIFPDLPVRDTGQRCEVTLLGLIGTITNRLLGKRLAVVCDAGMYNPPVKRFCWIEDKDNAGPGV